MFFSRSSVEVWLGMFCQLNREYFIILQENAFKLPFQIRAHNLSILWKNKDTYYLILRHTEAWVKTCTEKKLWDFKGKGWNPEDSMHTRAQHVHTENNTQPHKQAQSGFPQQNIKEMETSKP